jgi:hypothetical protein
MKHLSTFFNVFDEIALFVPFSHDDNHQSFLQKKNTYIKAKKKNPIFRFVLYIK